MPGIILFYSMAGIAILFAAIVVRHPNPVASAMSLVVTICALAVMFLQMGAPFIAAIQIIVYAGAIIVLFLFVIMLLNLRPEAPMPEERPIQNALAWIVMIGFMAGLIGTIKGLNFGEPARSMPHPVNDLAKHLFSDYLFAFEAVTVLLMAAAVGAFFLVRRDES